MFDKLPYFSPRSKLVVPEQPHYDDFLDTMQKVFLWSRGFGVAGSSKIGFWLVWGSFIMGLMFAVQLGAIYKLIKLLMGLTAYSAGNRSVTARLAGTVFYTTCSIALFLSWRLSRLWHRLSLDWTAVEKRLTIPVPEDHTLKRRMIVMMVAMTFGAFVEHAMSVVSSIELFDKPILKLLETYVLQSHGFIFIEFNQGLSGPVLKRIYYMVSLLWVCNRFGCVVLYAADVNVTSRDALRYLHACSARCNNVEIDRLQQQLAKDYVALSGKGFFHIDRSILLKMVASIITYELVLIQFDSHDT